MAENSNPTTVFSREHLFVLLVYIFLITLFYSPVVFGGRTLNPALYQPHGVLAGGAYQQTGRTPVNSFSVDIATPAYYEFPINKLVGDTYKKGDLPLWNPYQAGGTPLVAQYSTRAFFPYQILEDMSPVRAWDFFMLGRILIAGFFTYLFLSSLGLGLWSAFAGGVFYMFSGAFTWFINLEQFVNPAMMLPVLIFTVEGFLRALSRGAGKNAWTALLAVVFALVLLAGQPEVALYILALASTYFIFRSLRLFPLKKILNPFLRYALSYITGVAMAAPLILLFLELMGASFHIHPMGGLMGVQRLSNWKSLFAVINPTATQFPANPEMIRGFSLLTKIKGEYFRYFPINGVWDTLGGYTGVIAVFVALTGLVTAFSKRVFFLKKEIFFFASAAGFIILKNLGMRPFVWLGRLPFFDMVWSLRWAGPVWVFSIAAAAAIGLEALSGGRLEDEAERERHGEPPFRIKTSVVVFAVFSLLLGLFIIYSFMPTVVLTLNRKEFYNGIMRPFVIPSLFYGSIVTIILLTTAFLFLLSKRDRFTLLGLIALSVVELWWDVPRGYGAGWIVLKLMPFAVGIAAAVLFYARKIQFAVICAVIFFIASFTLDALSPRGVPSFHDPFTPAPYVNILRKKTIASHARAAGAYGVLFPNFSGAVGIEDLRYVNSLLPTSFYEFNKKYLHAVNVNETVVSALWFTGRPERSFETTPGDPTKGAPFSRPVEEDLLRRQRGYSFLGVRYYLFPGDTGYGFNPRKRFFYEFKKSYPLVYDREVKVFENSGALKRVFVAENYLYAGSGKEARKTAFEGDFDLSKKIVLEEKVKRPEYGGIGPPFKYEARIKQYETNKVTVEVDSNRAGVVVLTDLYYPGWKVLVNGVREKVLRVNGLVRGVKVGPGKSTEEFYYLPDRFVAGILISIVAFILCICLTYTDFRRGEDV